MTAPKSDTPIEEILNKFADNGYINMGLIDKEYKPKLDLALKQIESYYQNLYLGREKEARIDEILKMRAVGERTAAQAGATFEELSGAYDAHILKRAADLTAPPKEASNGKS